MINHVISVEGPDTKKTACYDIDVEIDDSLKVQMNNFVMSTGNQQEIAQLDSRIHDTVETINVSKTNREFFLGFAKDPQQFIAKWLISQNRDLKVSTDTMLCKSDRVLVAVDDRPSWQPGGGAPVGLFLPAVDTRRRVPLLLRKGSDSPSRSGAGARNSKRLELDATQRSFFLNLLRNLALCSLTS